MPLTTSEPSDLENNFNDWMNRVFGQHGWGRGAFRPTEPLNRLAMGQIPDVIKRQWQTALDYNLAGIRESMGSVGARFGTDITNSLGRATSEATTDLGATAMQNVINANLARANMASPLLNSSQGLMSMHFNRQENALERALREFLASQEAGGLDPAIIAALRAAGINI